MKLAEKIIEATKKLVISEPITPAKIEKLIIGKLDSWTWGKDKKTIVAKTTNGTESIITVK